MSVAVSHDGVWVVSGSKDRGVQFWDSRSAIVQCMLQGHKNSGECFPSPFLSSLLLFLELGIVVNVSFFLLFFCLVISIDLSPAGNILATGSGDWQARICAYFSLFSIGSPD